MTDTQDIRLGTNLPCTYSYKDLVTQQLIAMKWDPSDPISHVSLPAQC